MYKITWFSMSHCRWQWLACHCHWPGNIQTIYVALRCLCVLKLVYRTAGNIGGEINLAVWRLGKRPSNLNPSNLSAIYACTCAHIICTELLPNLNPPIFLFRPLGTKPPNLKIANISGYTVVVYVHDHYCFTKVVLHLTFCSCVTKTLTISHCNSSPQMWHSTMWQSCDVSNPSIRQSPYQYTYHSK